ncbi:MAG: gamma-glutamyltransferase [Gammaproteobacteria bacterium]|nr:gamma-glutamyltransferase [Gammaproteobacteria bacterium]
MIKIFRAVPAILVVITFIYPVLINANEVSSFLGVVSSRSELASQAGIKALEQGGNAIDAAVATAFTLAVTYPAAGNLGGGGFMVVYLADGSSYALDFREMAPAAATRDMFLDENGDYNSERALRSRMSSGVPGSVAGLLAAQDKLGKLGRQAVLTEAIRLAENGFQLPDDIAKRIRDRRDVWLRSEGSKQVFLKLENEKYLDYNASELFVQTDLATTLKRISKEGTKGFYEGETADLIVAEMQRGNGLISHGDLKRYTPVWREPVHGTYRDYQIISMPPPSSGGVLFVQMLNMLEKFDVGELGFGTLATIHLMSEVERRAYADRATHLGDSDFYPVPIDELIDKKYASERMEDFTPDKASKSATIEAGKVSIESLETTHLSVIDHEGNAVALTTTLNSGYGNGYVVEGAGFLLNNEMDDFSAKPGEPNQFGLVGAEANAIVPRKRMLSSMTPTIVVNKEEDYLLVTGSPGGSTIITTVLQVVVNSIDHKMTLYDAVASPRFHHQWLPDRITLELQGFDPEIIDELLSLGHETVNRSTIGDANSAQKIGNMIIGVSDPRNDGRAVGLKNTQNSQ